VTPAPPVKHGPECERADRRRAIALGGCYAAILAFPEPRFPWYTERGRLSLYSDQQFDAATAQQILDTIDTRLSPSSMNRLLRSNLPVADGERADRPVARL